MLDEKNIDRLFRMSEAYYLPSGYHVLEHRQDVIENARRLGELALKNGHRFNPVTLDLSAAWHDAGLALNPADMFFEAAEHSPYSTGAPSSAEHLAGILFWQQATKYDIPFSLAKDVLHTILGTNPDMPIETTEAKLLAAADLVAVGFGSYQEFKKNTILLWEEAQMKKGEQVDWPGFVAGSINYLGKFTARKIQLTPDYLNDDGYSSWHAGAVDNILQLARETWPNMTVASSVREPDSLTSYPYEEIVMVGGSNKEFTATIRVPLEKGPLVNL